MTLKRAKILIIDDMPTNLMTLSAVLYKECELQIATTGAMGLELARQSPPDLILLDVLMPRMDGYDTCRHFKADPNLRAIPIIFVTALAESEAEYAGLELGAADYLTKPLNIKIAKQRILNLLDRENLYREVQNYRDRLEQLVEARTLDLSLSRAHESELEGIAYYDSLTGVPNRRLLMDRLGQALSHTQRTKTLLGICYFDLDKFKPVNDKLGHDAGDLLLVEITNRVKTILRADDTLARMGGDEFVLLLNDLTQDTECYEILQRVLAAIRLPLTIKKHEVAVSASIGVTFYQAEESVTTKNQAVAVSANQAMLSHQQNDQEIAKRLLEHADHAMYQAKREGKDCFSVFGLPFAHETVTVH